MVCLTILPFNLSRRVDRTEQTKGHDPELSPAYCPTGCFTIWDQCICHERQEWCSWFTLLCVCCDFYQYPSGSLHAYWGNHMILQCSERSLVKVGKSSQMHQLRWYYKPKQNKAQKTDCISGLILGLCPANEKRCYFVTTSLIGWVQA